MTVFSLTVIFTEPPTGSVVRRLKRFKPIYFHSTSVAICAKGTCDRWLLFSSYFLGETEHHMPSHQAAMLQDLRQASSISKAAVSAAAIEAQAARDALSLAQEGSDGSLVASSCWADTITSMSSRIGRAAELVTGSLRVLGPSLTADLVALLNTCQTSCTTLSGALAIAKGNFASERKAAHVLHEKDAGHVAAVVDHARVFESATKAQAARCDELENLLSWAKHYVSSIMYERLVWRDMMDGDPNPTKLPSNSGAGFSSRCRLACSALHRGAVGATLNQLASPPTDQSAALGGGDLLRPDDTPASVADRFLCRVEGTYTKAYVSPREELQLLRELLDRKFDSVTFETWLQKMPTDAEADIAGGTMSARRMRCLPLRAKLQDRLIGFRNVLEELRFSVSKATTGMLQLCASAHANLDATITQAVMVAATHFQQRKTARGTAPSSGSAAPSSSVSARRSPVLPSASLPATVSAGRRYSAGAGTFLGKRFTPLSEAGDSQDSGSTKTTLAQAAATRHLEPEGGATDRTRQRARPPDAMAANASRPIADSPASLSSDLTQSARATPSLPSPTSAEIYKASLDRMKREGGEAARKAHAERMEAVSEGAPLVHLATEGTRVTFAVDIAAKLAEAQERLQVIQTNQVKTIPRVPSAPSSTRGQQRSTVPLQEVTIAFLDDVAADGVTAAAGGPTATGTRPQKASPRDPSPRRRQMEPARTFELQAMHRQEFEEWLRTRGY